MNLKEFIKNKKLEVDTFVCNFDKQNYGYALFNTGYVGRRNTTACVIFDKNLDIVYFDNTITYIYNDDYTDIFNIARGELQGVINSSGQEIIPCIYDSISLCRGYREVNEKTPIWVRKDKKEALFDRNGNQISKLYDDINFWNEISSYYIFRDNEYSGVIDDSGKELFKLKWAILDFLTEKILIYKDNFEFGLIDVNGKILTEAKYEHIKKINDNTFIGIKPDRTAKILNLNELEQQI